MLQSKILVTGSHRSGTTWVGKMLSIGDDVLYLDEPFNLKYKKNSPFTDWFEFIDEDKYSEYNFYISSELKGNFKSYWQNIRKAQNITELKYRLNQNLQLLKKDHIVFKDPLAVFSTEFLAKKYGLKPIIIIRHPAAVISSIKIQNWEHDFSNFLKQSEFVTKYMPQYIEVIEEFVKQKKSPIAQGALLWTLIHQFILYLKKTHSNWLFIYYEEIARQPVKKFKELYAYVNLDFTERIEKKILEFSSSDNPRDQSSENPHTVKRNSELSINQWKSTLTKAELDVIRAVALDTANELGYKLF